MSYLDFKHALCITTITNAKNKASYGIKAVLWCAMLPLLGNNQIAEGNLNANAIEVVDILDRAEGIRFAPVSFVSGCCLYVLP